VLQIVAQVIREKSRPYDCIGRWDDDQFTIVLPGIVSTDAEKIAKRILTGVQASQISLTDGPPLEVKLSAGIASTQTINAYAEIDTFIQNAVLAMISSKKNENEAITVALV
jgi:diguanylate cyclase (GGDEF)-like protein